MPRCLRGHGAERPGEKPDRALLGQRDLSHSLRKSGYSLLGAVAASNAEHGALLGSETQRARKAETPPGQTIVWEETQTTALRWVSLTAQRPDGPRASGPAGQ